MHGKEPASLLRLLDSHFSHVYGEVKPASLLRLLDLHCSHVYSERSSRATQRAGVPRDLHIAMAQRGRQPRRKSTMCLDTSVDQGGKWDVDRAHDDDAAVSGFTDGQGRTVPSNADRENLRPSVGPFHRARATPPAHTHIHPHPSPRPRHGLCHAAQRRRRRRRHAQRRDPESQSVRAASTSPPIETASACLASAQTLNHVTPHPLYACRAAGRLAAAPPTGAAPAGPHLRVGVGVRLASATTAAA